MGRYGPAPRRLRNDVVRNDKSFNLMLRVVLSEKGLKGFFKGQDTPSWAHSVLGFSIASDAAVCYFFFIPKE